MMTKEDYHRLAPAYDRKQVLRDQWHIDNARLNPTGKLYKKRRKEFEATLCEI